MKKILIYGSSHWPGCEPVKEVLSQKNIEFAYVDITSSMFALKSFLKIRDNDSSHKEVRASGGVGIPTLSVDGKNYLIADAKEMELKINELGL